MKKLFNKNESGRSMVEMLGVLAIIGVLSVGGIAGYRMAMNRHQVNTFLQRFSMIYNAVQFAYHQPNSYMSCCSYDSTIENSSFSGCDPNGADWRDEQRDEIISYLGDKDTWCPHLLGDDCFIKDGGLGDRRFGWVVYLRYRTRVPELVISFRLHSTLDENICADFIRGVINSSDYSDSLLGIHWQTKSGWGYIDPTEENIKTVCSQKNGISFHFYKEMDQCAPE